MDLLEVKIMEVPSALSGEVSCKIYKENLTVVIIKLDSEFIEFDVVGIYPGLINAFRRILLSELPTMAIEKVSFFTNTSVLQDEILAHRLGLIPLKADPRLFQYRLPDREATDRDTLHFELKAICEKNPHARFGHKRSSELFCNSHVVSGAIKWLPIGEQPKLYKESQIGPVQSDIVIAKLKPGLEIHAKLEAVKGIGRDHAKFSPVGTASYKLLPSIEILEDVVGEDAKVLQTCFTPGVIGIKSVEGKDTAYVQNARIDSCSRNVFYYENLKNKVRIGLTKDHYIFTIEPVNGTKPNDLFKESVKTLKQKCITALDILEKICAKKMKDKK